MTKWPDHRTSDAVLDEAIAWVVRVQSDAATAADWHELEAWLGRSEHHRRAYSEVEELSGEIADGAEQLARQLRDNSCGIPRRGAAVGRLWAWSAGAVALAVVVLAAAIGAAPSGREKIYRTSVGETRMLAFSDGSSVTLNALTTLRVRMGWRQRHVALGDGEASFDVAKDRRPFVIDVGDERVRVVGTAFNIRHYDHLFVLTVSRGVVEARVDGSPDAPQRLGAGQQLQRRDGGSAGEMRAADPSAASAWTQGRLICADRPLAEIAADINRRYRTPVLLGPQATGARFSGVIELQDEETAVRRLAAFLRLPLRRTRAGFILG